MQLVSAVFVALGVTVLLLIIPVVHFISGPIGPFVGGFIAIGRWRGRPESAFGAGLAFGSALWLLQALVGAVAIVILAFATVVISGGTGALVIGAVVGGCSTSRFSPQRGAIVSASRVKKEEGESRVSGAR